MLTSSTRKLACMGHVALAYSCVHGVCVWLDTCIKWQYVSCNLQVERPRIEKKQVTSEHPVIKRKKKKYKDPENLCKLPFLFT